MDQKNYFKRVINAFFSPIKKNPTFFLFFLFLIAGLSVVAPLRFHYGEWSLYGKPFIQGYAFAALLSYGMSVFLALFNKRGGGILKCILYSIGIFLFISSLWLYFELNSYFNLTILTLIAQTNATESSEFISQYIITPKSLLYVGLLILLIIAIIICEKKEKQILKNITDKYKTIIKFVIFVFVVAGLYIPFILYYEINTIETPWLGNRRNAYTFTDIPSNIIRTLCYAKKLKKSTEDWININRSVFQQQISTTEKDATKVVLILGESHSKIHSSIYGYTRQTMPNISKEINSGNAIAFSDIITVSSTTTGSIRNLFTLNSLCNNENWYQKPYWPLIFRKAGYNVELWDNQNDFNANKKESWDIILSDFQINDLFMDSCYAYIYMPSHRYDGQMIDVYEKSKTSGKTLVLIHLMGQHFMPERRYPDTTQWKYFTNSDSTTIKDWIEEEELQIINDYDNATRYVDFQLGRIIEKFRDDNAIIIYFSDHGEEIFDYRKVFGRQGDEPVTKELAQCLYDVPFFIWFSDQYKMCHPDVVDDIRKSINKPGMLDNVGQMFFHVGGLIENNPYYIKERDILSDEYCIPNRKTERFNYDDLMQ